MFQQWWKQVRKKTQALVDIANAFNLYFAKIGSNLAESTRLQNSPIDIHLKSPIQNSFAVYLTASLEENKNKRVIIYGMKNLLRISIPTNL